MDFRISFFLFLILLPPILQAADQPGAGDEPTDCSSLLSLDQPPKDLWLEEIEGAEALAWVNTQNDQTLNELKSQPIYPELLGDISKVLLANDRVPFATYSKGYFWDFWQDAQHKKGIYRRATYAEYLKENPKWETVLDVDALSVRENENWVFKKPISMGPDSSKILVRLSRGGTDAIVIREYDVEKRQFVANGFLIPAGKSTVAVVDPDTLLIAMDSGPDSVTDAGYPREVRAWKRGQKISDAKLLFRGEKSDVSSEPFKIQHGAESHVLYIRWVSFHEAEYDIAVPNQPSRRLPLPTTAKLYDIRDNQVYALMRKDYVSERRVIKAGSFVRISVSATSFDESLVIWEPGLGQAITQIQVMPDRLFINVLDNIKSRVVELKPSGADTYVAKDLPLPAGGIVKFFDEEEDDPQGFLSFRFEGFLNPEGHYRMALKNGEYSPELLKQGPIRFLSEPFEAVQFFATSKDGTQIPYSVVRRKDLVLDGSHPTIVTGYGGFNYSFTPTYVGLIGNAWLARGGVYVVANIRGGGEYGAEWHRSALRENRQRSYDDFAAVAEDLSARKITSPAHLGIQGGSNGGLLVANVMLQRPELMNAVMIRVPLLDMIRYSKLLAGSSWMAEYGDPDVPADREFLLRHSAYHNVRADQSYPIPFFMTSTKDDRVHPGHARRMAARMIENGYGPYYYESLDGGHKAGNPHERAEKEALTYTYFWKQLLGSSRR